MRKYLLGLVTFAVAFGILSVSVLESASVSYVFATPPPDPTLVSEIPEVDYQLPYPGRILPDSPFWVVKAARDKIWYTITVNPEKRAELALLFSDKRLAASKILFEKKKPEIALSTLTKGEKYLEISWGNEELARQKGSETSALLTKLAIASLKHRQVIEEILPMAPEDARPLIIKVEDYSKALYKAASEALNSKGIPSPKNPFDGQ